MLVAASPGESRTLPAPTVSTMPPTVTSATLLVADMPMHPLLLPKSLPSQQVPILPHSEPIPIRPHGGECTSFKTNGPIWCVFTFCGNDGHLCVLPDMGPDEYVMDPPPFSDMVFFLLAKHLQRQANPELARDYFNILLDYSLIGD
jgi:hypothetical protein